MDMYKSLKEVAWEANMEIPQRNLAIYTWGNVSAYDEQRAVFAIKPSGVPYDQLKAEHIVVVDLEGNIVDGSLRPSSDMKTHMVLYRTFKGIGGITHTHSPYAVSWAQACRSIPVFGTTHADHSHLSIPCTPLLDKKGVEGDYEEETGKLIVKTFNTIPYQEQPMVLVAGHGPFAWGKNATGSVYNAAVLEEVAKMALFTLTINPEAKSLPEHIVNKHYQRKHGPNAYYGQK
ncbi:MAG: L-ribulose-5-phosphate 4-epimerase AraD [Sphaerochaetaceae bacterium]|jgi:L-ribulose-5-phosphate 4-epimerase|nr:L-ribulose-5-phosphate 4-epimerase AraD [Sphaerochaetaceae bacterium]NLO60170.1 L-ribulose-5-phosphate 4-epimerase AraD [Spirochaetales bacterium]MDD2405822.1 L-ribulose-5-phosphate 4-epimerase AraD [Sphaerochaetaceae bacterium]MDD4260007.1 L-ribulose-5-phosphate 4-epimerase AraD [Sphaerochaetaceae bacterium]MDD4763128.1 L-ribulose-5-phosphate 4-epimerase AraD [Sphaerochaetaceae bacterium]